MSELRETFACSPGGFYLPESIQCIYGKLQPDLCFYAPHRNSRKVVGEIMLCATAWALGINDEGCHSHRRHHRI